MSALIGFLILQSSSVGLETLDLTPMTNGWSRPGINRSIENKPLTMGGKVFARGIGAHAPSVLHLKLQRAKAFDAIVGVDDETKGRGTVEFLVIVDGAIKWRSNVMRGGDAPKTVHVDLTNAKTMTLKATDGGDGSGYDHANWAEPRITTDGPAPTPVRDLHPIRIETANAALGLYVAEDGKLLQRSFGAKKAEDNQSQIAYPVSGDGWHFEPALQVRHADGNTSTDLRVVKYSTSPSGLTKIELKDPQYPFFVDLFFQSYPGEDVIEAWTEVRHTEKGTVKLEQFASSAPDLGTGEFWLTQFRGDWADEANITEEKLTYGVKTIDSKLGVRAHQFRAPWFMLAKGGPAQEDSGEVVGGSLAWSGSFAFKFETDPKGRLRAMCGMNPYASEYHLKAGEKFETPKMVWAWSDKGTGELSRKLHRWTRKHTLREGDKSRAILLNNWEATYFDFDEKKIVSLFDGAKQLGMELFLLDDGWFGKKYPRDGDTQGLGDWMPDPKKLPNGLGVLPKEAIKRGLRFGIWLEPEMVNPKSELFEKHPDWAIQQPKRPLDLQRNQLVLDMTNPAVEKYVYEVCDKTLRENPGISYVKWDCNRYLTQPGSAYLGPDRQSHLWIDYTRALYRVMDKLAKAHPEVEIMMCSGGGGRVDYGSMRYAHELWPSDMTDPAHRIFIQWGFSHFFPTIATSNHVTHGGNRPLKFAFDVAMSGRLGMDMDVDKMSAADRKFATDAISAYKGIRDVVQLGEQYRLESPYKGVRSSLMNVRGNQAVVFVYSLGDSPAAPLKLKGLDAAKRYRVREINLAPGATAFEGTFDGAALMGEGLAVPALGKYTSGVYELTAQ
jgi:alpha-galactosidase